MVPRAGRLLRDTRGRRRGARRSVASWGRRRRHRRSVAGTVFVPGAGRCIGRGSAPARASRDPLVQRRHPGGCLRSTGTGGVHQSRSPARRCAREPTPSHGDTMRLSRLELSGFKSFAGTVELPFELGVTAIVGPNGCGKSNISDAVRWVLGEQSPRLLRGGKMEDVIFQGSTGRRPVNVAEVSLVFDNSDGTLPIAYQEVVVTRRLSRSGQSEYLLNRSPVRLRDIQDLLRGTGLGADAAVVMEAKIIEVQTQVRSLARQRGRAERYGKMVEERFGVALTLVRREIEDFDLTLGSLGVRARELAEALPAARGRLADAERERETRVQARHTAEARRTEVERRLA